MNGALQLGASNPTFQFLEVFCYKKYADYQATSGLPQLSDSQLEKLRLLTLVSLCADQKVMLLHRALGLTTVFLKPTDHVL